MILIYIHYYPKYTYVYYSKYTNEYVMGMKYLISYNQIAYHKYKVIENFTDKLGDSKHEKEEILP